MGAASGFGAATATNSEDYDASLVDQTVGMYQYLVCYETRLGLTFLFFLNETLLTFPQKIHLHPPRHVLSLLVDMTYSSTTCANVGPLSLDKLPGEVISHIIFFLDNPALVASTRAAKVMRPHAEHHLYRTIEFPDKIDFDGFLPAASEPGLLFLRAILANPRLGQLVIHFTFDAWRYIELTAEDPAQTVAAHTDAVSPIPEAVSILERAVGLMPNLGLLKLSTLPNSFHLPSFQQLRKLCVRFVNFHETSSIALEHSEILHTLRNNRGLQQLSLFAFDNYQPSQARLENIESSFRDVCPVIQVLEGENTVIRAILPGRNVKRLFWVLDQHSEEQWWIDTGDGRLQHALFTPALCEAYRRLEELVVMSSDMSLLPLLAPHLSALKSLLLWQTGVQIIGIKGSKIFLHEKFLGAVGQIENLERLVVASGDGDDEEGDPANRVTQVDYEAIYAACKKLKILVFLPGPAMYVYQRDSEGSIQTIQRRSDRTGRQTYELLEGWLASDKPPGLFGTT